MQAGLGDGQIMRPVPDLEELEDTKKEPREQIVRHVRRHRKARSLHALPRRNGGRCRNVTTADVRFRGVGGDGSLAI